jgi:hypothetical protein
VRAKSRYPQLFILSILRKIHPVHDLCRCERSQTVEAPTLSTPLYPVTMADGVFVNAFEISAIVGQAFVSKQRPNGPRVSCGDFAASVRTKRTIGRSADIIIAARQSCTPVILINSTIAAAVRTSC